MESCNKDEAFKAKVIAEKRLLEADIRGAKKFALMAQRLFPKLDGLSQFLVVVDVYVAHENKINGQLDYYGIFGVDRLADEQVLKKQYKKMALSLHPDKNKSVGAEGAFKIMSQAWSVLSDNDNRNAYNSKLNKIHTRPHAPGTSASKPKRNVANPIICPSWYQMYARIGKNGSAASTLATCDALFADLLQRKLKERENKRRKIITAMLTARKGCAASGSKKRKR